MEIILTAFCIVMICIFTATKQDRAQADAWFRRHNLKFTIICVTLWAIVIGLYLLGRTAVR